MSDSESILQNRDSKKFPLVCVCSGQVTRTVIESEGARESRGRLVKGIFMANLLSLFKQTLMSFPVWFCLFGLVWKLYRTLNNWTKTALKEEPREENG